MINFCGSYCISACDCLSFRTIWGINLLEICLNPHPDGLAVKAKPFGCGKVHRSHGDFVKSLLRFKSNDPKMSLFGIQLMIWNLFEHVEVRFVLKCPLVWNVKTDAWKYSWTSSQFPKHCLFLIRLNSLCSLVIFVFEKSNSQTCVSYLFIKICSCYQLNGLMCHSGG
jgi:hypothetical protein